MKRIVLVLPWCGPLPHYWPAWQASARGRCFDILVLRKSLAEFSALLRQKLDYPMELHAGYKLCDFKPMYGVVFADELKGYDYWAFGDCDVMYGHKLDAWLEKVLAEEPDIVSVQAEFCAGPFTVVRNCDRCNRLFEKASGWREMLAVKQTIGFDELGSNWFRKMVFGGATYADLRKPIDTFSALCWHEAAAGRLKLIAAPVIREESLRTGESVRTEADGRLMKGDEELALYHFISAKTQFGFTGDATRVWVSRGWPFVRDVLRFAWKYLRKDVAARARVQEWWLRKKGDPDWWRELSWNNRPVPSADKKSRNAANG